jgi:hypothetical protein
MRIDELLSGIAGDSLAARAGTTPRQGQVRRETHGGFTLLLWDFPKWVEAATFYVDGEGHIRNIQPTGSTSLADWELLQRVQVAQDQHG